MKKNLQLLFLINLRRKVRLKRSLQEKQKKISDCLFSFILMLKMKEKKVNEICMIHAYII